MPAPSQLYFRNIRSSQYFSEPSANSAIDVYRLRTWPNTTSKPLLYPLILLAPQRDEAYIFIRTNAFPGLASPLKVISAAEEGWDTLELSPATRVHQLAFAENIYTALQEEKELFILLENGQREKLFDNRVERSAFLMTMRDYYRLTERL